MLEDHQVAEVPIQVQCHRPQQAWNQRGAQDASFLAERISQRHDAAQRIVGGKLQTVQIFLRHEAIVDRPAYSRSPPDTQALDASPGAAESVGPLRVERAAETSGWPGSCAAVRLPR